MKKLSEKMYANPNTKKFRRRAIIYVLVWWLVLGLSLRYAPHTWPMAALAVVIVMVSAAQAGRYTAKWQIARRDPYYHG